MTAQALVIDRELERLEGLWENGLSDAYRAYLQVVDSYAAPARPKLALAAALIEAGTRLQGLGGRAAPAAALLVTQLLMDKRCDIDISSFAFDRFARGVLVPEKNVI